MQLLPVLEVLNEADSEVRAESGPPESGILPIYGAFNPTGLREEGASYSWGWIMKMVVTEFLNLIKKCRSAFG